MEFLPPEDFDEIYFDMQNVYVEDPPSYPPKISLSMIKEEENVITVIIPHSQNDYKGNQSLKGLTLELML